MKWFLSLDIKYQVLIIIVILLLIFFIWRKYGTKIRNLFQRKEITSKTVTLQDGTVVTLSNISDIPQKQRAYLEDLAGEIKRDIHLSGGNLSHEVVLYKEASSLSDVEIDYLAQYYKRNLTNGTSLYEDMDNEAEAFCYYQDCSGWKLLITRLEKTGNR